MTEKESLEDGRVKGNLQWSGTLPISPFIMADPILSKNSTFGFIGLEEKRIGIQGNGENLKNGPINLFNLVGDADASGTALRIIQTVEKQIKPQHCFNRPENVFRTSRGSLPETLANIPGKGSESGIIRRAESGLRDI